MNPTDKSDEKKETKREFAAHVLSVSAFSSVSQDKDPTAHEREHFGRQHSAQARNRLYVQKKVIFKSPRLRYEAAESRQSPGPRWFPIKIYIPPVKGGVSLG
jgi:hypothetical protein